MLYICGKDDRDNATRFFTSGFFLVEHLLLVPICMPRNDFDFSEIQYS
jgi:hypothetical protein